MPLYEYLCESCEERFEVIQKFSDEPLTIHEKCGGPVRRLISPSAFNFKGSGWYVTDYAKGNGGAKPKAEGGAPAGGEGSKEGAAAKEGSSSTKDSASAAPASTSTSDSSSSSGTASPAAPSKSSS